MIVFAQISTEDLARAWRYSREGSWDKFGVFAAAIVTVAVVLLFAWRMVHYRRVRRRPLLLFHDLVDFHDIPRKSQKALLRFARTHGVADPAYFFVCPELVRHVESLEMAQARSEKDRRRLTDFFSGFTRMAFGKLAAGADVKDGGAM